MVATIRSLQKDFSQVEFLCYAKEYWEHPMFRKLACWPQEHLDVDSNSEIASQLKQAQMKLRDIAACGLKTIPFEIMNPDISSDAKEYLERLHCQETNLWSPDEYSQPKEDTDYLTHDSIGYIGNIAVKCGFGRLHQHADWLKRIPGLHARGPEPEYLTKIREFQDFLRILRVTLIDSTRGQLVETAMTWVQLMLAFEPNYCFDWLHLSPKDISASKAHFRKCLPLGKINTKMLKVSTDELVHYLSCYTDNHQDELMAAAIKRGELVIDVKRRRVYWDHEPVSNRFREGRVLFEALLALAQKSTKNEFVHIGDLNRLDGLGREKQLSPSGFRKCLFDLKSALPKSLAIKIETIRQQGYKLVLEPCMIKIFS
jgi:hypothetical protein